MSAIWGNAAGVTHGSFLWTMDALATLKVIFIPVPHSIHNGLNIHFVLPPLGWCSKGSLTAAFVIAALGTTVSISHNYLKGEFCLPLSCLS